MDLEYVKGKPLFTSINKINHQFNYLTENLETDVIIIGGGVTGSICGYYLSKNNIKTTILEKGRVAHGSTSITTSLLQYELDDNLSELSNILGLKNSLKAYNLGLLALKEIDNFIFEYGNNCDYIKRDTLLYTATNLEKNAIKQEYSLRKEYGFDVEYLDSSNNKYPFELKSGITSKNGGLEIDPYKYTMQLLNVSIDMGLNIYENTEVKNIHYYDDYIEVETSYGYKVKGKKIIVATGYNTALFTNRNFGTKFCTFNIATKPIENLNKFYDGTLIRDNSDPYNYIRSTVDNRIIIGGEDISFDQMQNKELVKQKYDILEQRLKSMFKNIKNIEIDYKYCGCFISTNDNLGFIGNDKNKDLWYCLGYGANGILFAILGGMFLSKLYKKEVVKDLELFKVNRFDS